MNERKNKMNIDVQIFEKGSASCHNKNENCSELVSVDLTVELEYHPLVSCLMVTRGDPELVMSALHCFEHQTYPNRELIIVCDNVAAELHSLIEKSRGAPVRVVSVDPGQALGSLRNIAVANAKGEILCQWDDDDLYQSDRLRACIYALIKSDVAAIFLKRWLIWWPEREILAFSMERLWEGSLVVRKDSIYPYPEIKKYEDTLMVESLLENRRIGLVDEPLLYCYTIHGNNTYDKDHFMTIINSASAILCYEKAINKLSSLFPFAVHKMWNHLREQATPERPEACPLLKTPKLKDLRCHLEGRVLALEKSLREQKALLKKSTEDKESLWRYLPIALLRPTAEFLSTLSRATRSQSIEKAAFRLWCYIN